MRIRYLTLIVVLAAAAGACGDSDPPAGDTEPPAGDAGSPATEADLEGRTLIATGVTEDGTERPLVEGTELRIDFSEPGMIGVTAGCNSMGGAYTLEDGTLVAADMASTMMACDQALMDQDAWIADLLAEGVEVGVDGDTVTFTGGATVITLADRETVSPDLSLTGTTWTLDEIRDTDSVSSVGVTATLTIDDDGAYHVETGCNTGNGTATDHRHHDRLRTDGPHQDGLHRRGRPGGRDGDGHGARRCRRLPGRGGPAHADHRRRRTRVHRQLTAGARPGVRWPGCPSSPTPTSPTR